MDYILNGKRVSRETYLRYRYHDTLLQLCKKWGFESFAIDFVADFYSKLAIHGEDKFVDIARALLAQNQVIETYEHAEAEKSLALNRISLLDLKVVENNLKDAEAAMNPQTLMP